jgi:hypothetical protein
MALREMASTAVIPTTPAALRISLPTLMRALDQQRKAMVMFPLQIPSTVADLNSI